MKRISSKDVKKVALVNNPYKVWIKRFQEIIIKGKLAEIIIVDKEEKRHILRVASHKLLIVGY